MTSIHINDKCWFTIILGCVCLKKTHNFVFNTTNRFLTGSGIQFVNQLYLGFFLSQYAWDPEYTMVLDMALILNMQEFSIYQGFWIYQGSEYTRVLNMPGFWMYQGSEYARVLNMPGFWLYQGSKYSRVRNLQGFWICQGFEYTRVLNMPRLWIYQGSEYARGLNIPHFWIYQGSEYTEVTQVSECAWLCLNMPEYWTLIWPYCTHSC